MPSTELTGSHVPKALVCGPVRAWHVVFLYVVIFVVTAMASVKLTATADPEWQLAWSSLLCQTITALLVALITLIVPELRRSVGTLFGPGRTPLTVTDALLYLALMLTWAYGAYRILFTFPLLHWNPGLSSLLGYYDHFPAVGAVFLLFWSMSTGLVAPFAEELVFRGYLQNLWHARRGLWLAVVLSAICFGLPHMQFAVFATVAGVFLSLVYLKFGSLCPGMLLHGLYNLIAAPYLLGHVFAEKRVGDFASLSNWIPELILTAAFFPLLYVFWRRFRPHT